MMFACRSAASTRASRIKRCLASRREEHFGPGDFEGHQPGQVGIVQPEDDSRAAGTNSPQQLKPAEARTGPLA